MKRILTLATFVLLAAGYIATEITFPHLQFHILNEGTACPWSPYCGPGPFSAAAFAGQSGLLIAMLLATVAALQFVLKRRTNRTD